MKSIFSRNSKLFNPFVKYKLKYQIFFHNTTNQVDSNLKTSQESFNNSRRIPFSKAIKPKITEKPEFNTTEFYLSCKERDYLERRSYVSMKGKIVSVSYSDVVKPYPFISSTLSMLNLLEKADYLNMLDEIVFLFEEGEEININPLSTVTFKFLLMTSQLIKPDLLSASQIQEMLPDLYYSFTTNFMTLFSKNPDILLIYNVFYFCFKNTGQFSSFFQKLDNIFRENPDVQSRLRQVLNTKFKVKTNPNLREFSLNHNYINNYEQYITTPSTHLINDIVFKYEDKLSKVRQITEDITMKRTVERAKYILGYFSKMQNYDKEYFEKMQNLQNSLKIISTYFLENVKDLFDKDIEIIYKEIQSISQTFDENVNKLTILNNPSIKIYLENFHEVYNPLFSGEFCLKKQFERLVNNNVNTKMALNLMKKYIDSQFIDGEIVSFYDLLKINVILNNKYSYKNFIQNNCLILYDYSEISDLDLINTPFIFNAKKTLHHILQNQKETKKSMISSHQRSSFSTSRKPFYCMQRRYFSSNKSQEYIDFDNKDEREKKVEENFAKYIKKADDLKMGIVEEIKIEEKPVEKVEEKKESEAVESVKKTKIRKNEEEESVIDFFSSQPSNEKAKKPTEISQKKKEFNKYYDEGKGGRKVDQDNDEYNLENYNHKVIKNGVDLTLAIVTYNLDWWNKKVLFYDNQDLMKKSLQNILTDSLLKDDIPMICYSLINFKFELNKTMPNPEIILYDIFINPIKETKPENKKENESIEEFIADHPFKYSLGYYGYLSLLKTANTKKSKSGLKKIIALMKAHKYQIPINLFEQIINMCIENKFPITLHEIMSEFIEEGNLPKEVFIKYSLYLDTFFEYSKEIRELSLNVQEKLKIPLEFSLIETFVIKLISTNRKKELLELIKNFKLNIEKNLDLPEFKNMSEEEKKNYLEETIFQTNYLLCLYHMCSAYKFDSKKEIDAYIKEIRNTRKKMKTPEYALINILYCKFINDAKNLTQYMNLFFENKNFIIGDMEFEEIIDLWDDGMIKKDLIAWKKLLQTVKNRNIFYNPKYIEKVINVYKKIPSLDELKVFLLAFDKDMYINYTFNQKKSLKDVIRNTFEYTDFKEINDQLNNLYYENRPIKTTTKVKNMSKTNKFNKSKEKPKKVKKDEMI